jgi:oxygen-independent coproporphyrinogen-3 oxidase
MIDQVEHIYLHWPFCKNRCHYCDFIALAKHEEFYVSYHQALCKEIELVTKNFETKPKIKSIFVGGGTPSLYPVNLLGDLFKVLENRFDLGGSQEITLEANPSDITKEKLQAWKQIGINRLSLGIQVLDDKVLKNLNRQQTVNDALHAIEIAPNYFKNISIDLILGLPEVTKQVWNQTLQQITLWPISHISIYFLTIYEKTPLYFRVNKKEVQLPEENSLVDTYKHSVNFLKHNGFFQYEISNFAKTGKESIHNQSYWNRKSYYGFGLGASSFISRSQERFTNINNIENYIQSVLGDNKIPISSRESLDSQKIMLEMLMLGLRQAKGLDLHDVLYLLTDKQKNQLYQNVELLKGESLLQQNDDRISLPLNSIILENSIVLKLYEGLF